MRGRLKRYVLAIGLALVLPLLALATWKFQKIDNPMYFRTLPNGINDAGWVVGTESTLDEKFTGTWEGFLLREGYYTKIFYMGAQNTDAGGINDEGKIVGNYGDKHFSEDHCFTYLDGDYQTFNVDLPNAMSPDCNGINKSGDTVGNYSDGMTNHGWLRKGDVFYPLDVTFTGASNTEAFGINKNDDVVGLYFDGLATQGFLLRNGPSGSYSTIHFPSSSSTKAFGINDRGDIVGSYRALTLGTHGFVLREGQWKTVDVNLTDALETDKVTGINNHGCMVGVYTDKDGKKHGFKASLREADGDADEPGKNGGTARMDFHEDDCIQQPEREDFSDPGSGIDFHSTQVSAVTYNDVAHSVTIVGLGTDHGLPVAFTIIAVDSTVVPPGMFSITLSDGYSNSGSLLIGTITLR